MKTTTKDELVSTVAAASDVPKAQVDKVLSSLGLAITADLKEGCTVPFLGLGRFVPKERAARTGRNPKTGEPVQIAACTAVTFKVGKPLKDAINS